MKPVVVELTDFKTKEKVDELEVDAVLVATGRAPYTQVGPSSASNALKALLHHLPCPPLASPGLHSGRERTLHIGCTRPLSCLTLK